MRTVQRARGSTAQVQQFGARLIAGETILLMAAEELHSRVEEEISLNPALEAAWDQVCPDCGRALVGGVCWACRGAGRGGEGRSGRATDTLPPVSTWTGGGGARSDGDDSTYDLFESTSEPPSLREHVLEQARLILPPRQFRVAEYLIASLNEDGLLECEPAEAAEALGVEPRDVEAVLSRLHLLDPAGVCARSVQESVLIQLRELSAEVPVPPHIELILRSHWRDLANHAYGKVGRALGLGQQQVEEAVAFIRRNLYPYPGRLYHPQHTGRRQINPQAVRPDILIRRDLHRYVVEIVRPYDCELRVSEAYERLCATLRRAGADSPEHEQALEHFRRATWLVECIRFREDMLRQITEYVAEFQRAFLDTELEPMLKQLTRTRVARYVGKQLPTVSRAIANKFVQLPSGEVVPLSKLMAPTVAPKTIIAELLAEEDPEEPLTDARIATILRVRGYNVARRTIAKYRLSLRLPSSAQRGRR